MACRSRCLTPGAHATLGECIRAARINIGQVDATVQRRWDAELNEYRSARDQGVQPSGTSTAATRRAMRISEDTGVAFDAGKSL